MKILVIGAGIGGLAAGSFLERAGFDVTIVERALEFKHIGFGMTLFSNARKILCELGVDDIIAQKGYEVPWIELADSMGHLLGEKIDFVSLQRFGASVIIAERADIHGALVSNLGNNIRLILGTSVKSMIRTKDAVSVALSNGSEETFDLVVAADGIHSQTREEVFGPDQTIFYDWSIRFFWVPRHIPILQGALCLSREGTMLALYPLRDKCFAGIYEYNPDQVNRTSFNLEGFASYLSSHGWRPEDIDALEQEAQEGHQYYDHLRFVKLGEWYKDRVVLLGDARHGFSPITGMGGTMALEDAFVLADELAKADPTRIDVALENYSRRRTDRINEVRSLGSLSERFFFIRSPFARVVRDIVARIFPASLLVKRLERILSQTP